MKQTSRAFSRLRNRASLILSKKRESNFVSRRPIRKAQGTGKSHEADSFTKTLACVSASHSNRCEKKEKRVNFESFSSSQMS